MARNRGGEPPLRAMRRTGGRPSLAFYFRTRTREFRMQSRTKALLASLAVLATIGTVATVPSASAAGGGGSTVVARGLGGPFGVQKAIGHRGFVVAENASGQVSRVMKDGSKRASVKNVAGVAGVAASPTRVFGVLGGGDETGQAPPSRFAPSTVFRSTYSGKRVKAIADLGRYELRHNPDGQVQFVDGHPVDALSNPFAMTWCGSGCSSPTAAPTTC